MTRDEMAKLKEGDIVQNLGSGTAYIVTRNCGDHVILVRTILMHNPDEWVKVATNLLVDV